jgi:hypothetical protein
MTEKIVLTLINHTVWGYVLQPVLASENEYGHMSILEPADSKSSGFDILNDKSRQLVLLSEQITDSNLMALFAGPKDKSIADFLKKVKPDTISGKVIPFIESVQRKMIELLVETDMKFFLREKVGIRNLYDSTVITVSTENAEAIFNFRKEEGIFYNLQITHEGESIDLLNKDFILLSSTPATLIIENKLLVFKKADIKKLNPFFTKEVVHVPASYEQNYINTFVKSCFELGQVVTENFTV